MNYKLSCFFLLIFALQSCKNDDQNRLADTKRDAKKKELIFYNINKGWIFFDTPINTASEATVSNWNEWRMFLKELEQKPAKTIGAFQKKAKALSVKAMALNTNIPSNFNNPPIKSRISTLITQIRLLDLYINLDNIPDQKVVKLVSEINIELVSLQRQMDKIVEKSKIPLEVGESELIKMMDTTRAIPATPTDQNLPRIE